MTLRTQLARRASLTLTSLCCALLLAPVAQAAGASASSTTKKSTMQRGATSSRTAVQPTIQPRSGDASEESATPRAGAIGSQRSGPSRSLQRVEPRMGRAAAGSPDLREKVFREAAPVDRRLRGRPSIESMLPIAPFVNDLPPGVIVPGGTVALIGRFFGSEPGKVIVKGPTTDAFGPGYRYGEIELVDLVWESPERVRGRIPNGISIPTAAPVTVQVRVHDATGSVSQPYPGQFQVPSETRWLTKSDVTVEVCGTDSNGWYCNGQFDWENCGFIWYTRTENVQNDPDAAIQGYHENCDGAVGNDAGTDRYRIALTNGWVFDHVEWSGKGFSSPSFPKGQAVWVPRIQWVAKPGEENPYKARIRVRRAVGN